MTSTTQVTELQEIGEMAETARNEGFTEADIQEFQEELEETVDVLSYASEEDSEDALEIFTAFDAGEITLDEAEALIDEMGLWGSIKRAARKVKKVATRVYKVGKKVYKTGKSIYRHPLVRKYVRPIISRLAKNTTIGRVISKGYRYAKRYAPYVRRGYKFARRYLPFEADVSSNGLGSTNAFVQGNIQSQQGFGVVMIPVIVSSSFGGFPVQSVQPGLQ